MSWHNTNNNSNSSSKHHHQGNNNNPQQHRQRGLSEEEGEIGEEEGEIVPPLLLTASVSGGAERPSSNNNNASTNIGPPRGGGGERTISGGGSSSGGNNMGMNTNSNNPSVPRRSSWGGRGGGPPSHPHREGGPPPPGGGFHRRGSGGHGSSGSGTGIRTAPFGSGVGSSSLGGPGTGTGTGPVPGGERQSGPNFHRSNSGGSSTSHVSGAGAGGTGLLPSRPTDPRSTDPRFRASSVSSMASNSSVNVNAVAEADSNHASKGPPQQHQERSSSFAAAAPLDRRGSIEDTTSRDSNSKSRDNREWDRHAPPPPASSPTGHSHKSISSSSNYPKSPSITKHNSSDVGQPHESPTSAIPISNSTSSNSKDVTSLPQVKPPGTPQRLSSYSSLASDSRSGKTNAAAAVVAAVDRQNEKQDRSNNKSSKDRDSGDRPITATATTTTNHPQSPGEQRAVGVQAPIAPGERGLQRTNSNSFTGDPLPAAAGAASNRTQATTGAAVAAAALAASIGVSSPLPPAQSAAKPAPATQPTPQPHRPSFHRKDPRARLQQQQQQQQKEETVVGPAGGPGGISSDHPASLLALRRNSSADMGDANSAKLRLERTGSGPMVMQGAADRHAGGRASWTGTGHGSFSSAAGQQGHPARSQSHGTNPSRRMSYPASPSQHRDNVLTGQQQDRVEGHVATNKKPDSNALDPFGRAPREWVRDASGSNSRGPPHHHERRGSFNNPNASPHTSPRPRKSFASLADAAPPPPLRSSPSKTLSMSTDHQPIPRRNSGGPHIDSLDGKMKPPSQSSSKLLDGIPKKHKRSPLLTSVLGESQVVARADGAVQSLQDLLQPNKDSNDTSYEPMASAEPLPLPTKQQIMKAMAMLDMKVKKTEQERVTLEGEIETAKEEEARAEEKKNERLQEEQKEEATRFLEEHRHQREHEHDAKMKVWHEQKKQTLDEEQKQVKEQMAHTIKEGQEAESKRLLSEMEEQVLSASEQMNKEIAHVKRDFEKATQAVSKSQVKAEVVQEEYDAAVKKDSKKGRKMKTPKSKQKHVANSCDVVKSILAENQRKAAEGHAMAYTMAMVGPTPSNEASLLATTHDWVDPKYQLSCAEWTQKVNIVTGPANALYNEPRDAPFFEHNAKMHRKIAPLVKEYIRHKKRKLDDAMSDLAEEYDYRKRKYNKHLMLQRRRGKSTGGNRGSLTFSRQSILGGKPSATSSSATAAVAAANVVAGRSTSNPYRRARRGNEVRSEYEQEQVIAELAAKEAMEKRIAFGGCKPAQQVLPLEHALGARYINTLEAQRVDPVALEEEFRITNVWTDMEKCIFLDRFLQFPKDFRKIGTFLRNKNTKDCVRFYYDSKQYVPYKAALKEHMMRRKRRGDYPVWDATIQAALSVGAVITAGPNEQRPLIFTLPDNDGTYWTKDFHPLQREIFDRAAVDMGDPEDFDEEELEAASKPRGGRPSLRYKREPFFTLAKEEKKFIKTKSKASSVEKETQSIPLKKKKLGSIAEEFESAGAPMKASATADGERTPPRKAPQKWSTAEKKIFVETLEKHGRNWAVLASAVGTKTIYQIKNYYYDYKKQAGKFRIEKRVKTSKDEDSGDAANPKRIGEKFDGEEATTAKKERDQHLEQLREEQRLVQEELEQRQEAARQQQLQTTQQHDGDEDNQKEQHQEQQRLLEQQQEQQLQQRHQQLLALQKQQQHSHQQDQHQRLLEQHQEQQRRHQQALALQQQQQQQQQQTQQRLQQLLSQQQQTQHSSQQQQTLQQRLQQQHGAQPSMVESRETGGAGAGGGSDFTADLWAQAQQQGLLNQHQQQQAGGHLNSVEAEARRLLQHHSHQTHHQQVLSNLLPWLQAAQVQQHASSNDSASQQLQHLLSLRQQQAAGSLGGHSSSSAAGASPSASQLRSLALAGLSGLNVPTHAHNQQQQQQQQHRLGEDQNDGNLDLARRLLAYQQQQQQQHGAGGSGSAAGGGGSSVGSLQGADAQALDALGLLARSAPPPNDGNNNNNQNHQQQGPSFR